MFNLVIIYVNDIFQEIFNKGKLGKMVRNISCQISRNTLMFMKVEEYIINEGCRFFIFVGRVICGMKLFVNKTSKK